MANDQKFLMIQNPGVAPTASFTLLGASTKRGNDAESNIVGKFGSGNKHGIATLIRNKLTPIVFAGSLRMDFPTERENMGNHTFERVMVKFGGKDELGTNRSNTEALGFVLDYGSDDWDAPELALREFISNALDRVVEDGEIKYSTAYLKYHNVTDKYDLESEQLADFKEGLRTYRIYGVKNDYANVVIEIVNANQVRAKAGHTRVFIPMSDDIQNFYNNLGKWFLHFSEPDSVNKEILPKANRNLKEGRKTAVIFRRGVRIREIEYTTTPSLFDYNFKEIPLDESRKLDDWKVKNAAGQALTRADKASMNSFWQSFFSQTKVWEQDFSQYSLSMPSGLTTKESDEIKKRWTDSFHAVVGEDAVVATKNGGEIAARKGYKVITVSDEVYEGVKLLGIRTPDAILTKDEQEGRVITDPTLDHVAAVEFIWKIMRQHNLLNNKEFPKIKGFTKVMEAGSHLLGYYREGTVYLNNELGNNASESGGWKSLTHQLMQTALEEVCHWVTGEHDFSRGFQDFAFNLAIRLAMANSE